MHTYIPYYHKKKSWAGRKILNKINMLSMNGDFTGEYGKLAKKSTIRIIA